MTRKRRQEEPAQTIKRREKNAVRMAINRRQEEPEETTKEERKLQFAWQENGGRKNQHKQ